MSALKRRAQIILWLPYTMILAVVAATTPISPSEAYLFFQAETTPTTLLMHWGDAVISSELGLRLFFLVLGYLNLSLFYAVTAHFFSEREERLLALYFYAMLPGVIVSTVLANDAVIIAFLVLLFLYFYLHQQRLLSLFPLLFLGLAHWSALYFYLLLMLYGLFQKEKWIFLNAAIAVLFFFVLGARVPEPVSGNYLFEMLGNDATIFSPLLFIYFFYALYGTLWRGERNVLWYISFGALIISLVLSLQERVRITDFSAYLMLGIIVAVHTYLGSLKVRLKRFRKSHRISFWVVAISLLTSSLAMVLHQPIYRLLGEKNYPIVASVYSPYDRAVRLKKSGKKCVQESRQKVLYQMRYYGLNKCF